MKKFKNNFKNLAHFAGYFENESYRDAFGHNPMWNEEIEKWLSEIKRIDKKHYDTQKGRVGTKKQRDELLGEYRAIYFIKKKCGLRILGLETPSIKGSNNDFSFRDKRGINWCAEVKSPSWEAEVFKDKKLTHKQKVNRKAKPQFISGEGRTISVDVALVDSIKKSLTQFNPANNNLLVISPNMLASTALLASFDEGHRIKGILKKHNEQNLIDCVLIIEPTLGWGQNKVIYHYELISSSNMKPELHNCLKKMAIFFTTSTKKLLENLREK